MRINKIALALMITFLSACSSTSETDPKFVDYGTPYTTVNGYNPYKNNTVKNDYRATEPDYSKQVFNNTTATTATTATTNILPVAKDTIYFMFDSSEVQAQFIPIINQYREYLIKNPNQIIILEGHADERGSREYNIALGEQRAKSVARIMQTAEGNLSNQLQFVSYGEEKPATIGHNEAAWRLNRRVNLIYQRN
jgi:peptidoglycan-associated lipoprotein